jgi:hypothetical protein
LINKPVWSKNGIVNLTRVWQTGVMNTKTPSCRGCRFPSEIISHASLIGITATKLVLTMMAIIAWGLLLIFYKK